MALAARDLGYEYIAICDHTPNVRVVPGLDADDLRRQAEEIAAVNEEVAPFRVLRGTEVDIRRDGELDLPDDILASSTGCSSACTRGSARRASELTRKVTEAMRHPAVRALSHPKGRIINHRPPNALDLERTFEVALETGVAIETNGLPDRLDLSGPEIRLAIEAGVPIVVSTDAHSVRGLGNMRLAVHTARRGWATAADVVNTRPLARCSAGAELGAADRPHRPAVQADGTANVVRAQQATDPPTRGRGGAVRRVVDDEPAVHRRADRVFVVEAEHMSELVRDDERHGVSILPAADSDLGAGDPAAGADADASFAGRREPADAEQNLRVVPRALQELNTRAARVPGERGGVHGPACTRVPRCSTVIVRRRPAAALEAVSAGRRDEDDGEEKSASRVARIRIRFGMGHSPLEGSRDAAVSRPGVRRAGRRRDRRRSSHVTTSRR